MNPLQKNIKKYQTDFSQKAWILRIITLSIALGAVIYYLNQHNSKKGMFFKNFAEKQEISVEPGVKFNIPVTRPAQPEGN